MRLLSLILRNYRLHRELTVEFDRERTLIGGPNESGKSTLVEAVHRALFLSAKGNGEPHRIMRPFHGAHPEVELTFEVGSQQVRVSKRFSGHSGTTALIRPGAPPLNGEAAESELARLLGVDGDVSARAACDHWAHLWVWQGVSGEDPAGHANHQKDSLIQRLSQADGAAAVMQSETDARVASTFSEACETIFKQGGKAKAGTDLANAEEGVAAAQVEYSRAAARLDTLRESLQTHAAATGAIFKLQEDLIKIQEAHSETEARTSQLTQLRRTEVGQAAEARTADAALAELQRIQNSIAQLRRKMDEITTSLAPQAEEIGRLTRARDESHETSLESFNRCTEAEKAARAARQHHDWIAAHVALLDKRERLGEVDQRVTQVSEVASSLKALQSDLSQLPPIERGQVQRLQKLQGALDSAKSALDGMAAGIEVVATDRPTHLGAEPLEAGASRIITEDTDITIGSSTRLRIRPGGGTSLAEARAAVQDARAKLTKQLDQLGVTGVETAAEVVHQRNELGVRILAQENRLKDLDADGIERKAQDAANAVVAAETDVERRASVLSQPPSAPADLSAGKVALTAAVHTLDQAETAENRARITRDTAAERLTTAETALTRKQKEVEASKRAQSDLEAQSRLLIEQYGDNETRDTRFATALQTKNTTDACLKATREAIALLQPDLLETDLIRLRRALDDIRRRQQESETQRAVAENTLRTDGSADPEAELALAKANLDSAEQRLDSVRRRANALRLLHELFQQEQQVLADRFTRPLVETVSNYLQSLFGPGARAEIRYDNSQFSTLSLVRPAMHGGSAITFESLSGGTKEQVATAMRLAMAEVLSANHNGCLPIVLDDAFTNGDPERVETLQRMLDLAATRGLQVIVMTCNPSGYRGLGARTVSLSAPVSVSGIATRAEDIDTDRESATTEFMDAPIAIVDLAGISDDHQLRFLAVLQQHGGSAGNTTLRTALRWDEPVYDEVKSQLVAAGRITRGKGRGGSVSIAAT